MYAGTDRIKRWLSDGGVRDIEVRQRRSELTFIGHSGFGSTLLKLSGLTPNSLYTTGHFVPLVLRLELGQSSPSPHALAARYVDGVLWQAAAGQRYRGATLCGSDPLSPLNRLTLDQIDTFLKWVERLLPSQITIAQQVAHASWLEARETLSLWQRVNQRWQAPWNEQGVSNRLFAERIKRSLEDSKLFGKVETKSGGRRGPLGIVSSIAARGDGLLREARVDSFHLDHPKASLALDDLLVDTKKLEASAAMIPERWIAVSLKAERHGGLEEIEGLSAFSDHPTYCAWMTADQVDDGALDEMLHEIGQRSSANQAGPYR